MPLDDAAVDEAERFIAECWPTATPVRCRVTAEALRPFNFSTVEAAVVVAYGKHDDELLHHATIIAHCRRLEPNAEHADATTAEQRTQLERDRQRQQAAAIECEHAANDAVLDRLSDAELEALRPRILERMGDARLPMHASKPIRRSRPMIAIAADLLREDREATSGRTDRAHAAA